MGDGAGRGNPGDAQSGRIQNRLPIEESIGSFERMPDPRLLSQNPVNRDGRKTGVEALDRSTDELLRKLQNDGKAETNLRHVVPGLNAELERRQRLNPPQMMPPRLEREGMPTGADHQTEMTQPGKDFDWKLIRERARMRPSPIIPRSEVQFPPGRIRH
ncbi:MAG: hypothetical protein IPM23_07410 [Candidatus Melainabacteria bacterium]|nr:hypothetical protein [Candidatus Melainabacteria bacterium]